MFLTKKLEEMQSKNALNVKRLFNTQKLNVEGEGGVAWNNSGMSACTVCIIGGADQLCSLSNRPLIDNKSYW